MSIKNTYTPIRLGSSSIVFTEAINTNFNTSKRDIKWLYDNMGEYELLPATEENLGGIKALPKTDKETVEVKIGANSKLYVAEKDDAEIWETLESIKTAFKELKITIATI